MKSDNIISRTCPPNARRHPSEAVDNLIKHIRENIESCIPGRFDRWDDEGGEYESVAIVTPLVKKSYISGNSSQFYENSPFRLRVLRVKSGGFWFRMPLKKGDTGWIIAADRDTSFAISRNANVDESKNTKENGGGPQEYSNFNKLKYSFGFFLPDGYCNIKVEKGHEDSSFWSMLKEDGSGDSDSYIELKKDGTVVIHPGGEEEKVLVEGFLDVNKNVDIDGTVTAEKKNADGTDNEDPVEIKDTEYLVPIDNDKNLYAIWKGRSFRNEGETSEPFKLTGGEGPVDGKLIKEVKYWPDENNQGTWIKFIYTDDTYDQILAPRGPIGPQGSEGKIGPPGPQGPPGEGGGGGGTGQITVTGGSGITVVPNGTAASSFTISAHWV
jgi:hypothetical protein